MDVSQENPNVFNEKPTRSASQKQALRAWLTALDGALRAVEDTVWQIRSEFAESAVAWRDWKDQVSRLVSAGWVLTKIATGYRFHLTRAAFVSEPRAAAMLDKLHEKNAQRFLGLCLSHGGGFLKVGQLLSARPDLLPRAWVDTLATLQDEVPPEPFAHVQETLVEVFDAPLEDKFEEFDVAPLASASIGQVHRAQLRDGTPVAVKVRRPSIDAVIATDMQILGSFVEGMKANLPPADYETIVAEVQHAVGEEVDYERERAHQTAVASFLAPISGVRAPALKGAQQGKRVLISELINGEKITVVLDRLASARADGDAAAHAELSKILNKVVEGYAHQILTLGRFQADPHPGNLLVEPDGTVVILDFGCTQQIDPDTRRAYAEFVQAFFVRDSAGMCRLLQSLGFETRSGTPDTLLRFAELMLESLRDASPVLLEQASTEHMVAEYIELMRTIEEDPVVRIPDHFVMIGRVFGTLGGLVMHYRPTLDVAETLVSAMLSAGKPAA